MKTKYFFSILILLIIIINFGCEKEKSPTGPSDAIPENLFPLEVGRQWVFDAFETDTAGYPIIGRTGKSIMKVLKLMELAGKQCFELVDTTKIADSTNVTYNYFHLDLKSNLWQYLFPISDQPGPEYIRLKTYTILYSDSGWLKIFNREIGFNQVHIVLDTILQTGEIPVRFRIQSLIRNRTSMTVPIGQFNEVYPGELEFQISAGIITFGYKFYVWLVPGVGFIKFKEPIAPDFGQPIKGYIIKVLRSKNF